MRLVTSDIIEAAERALSAATRIGAEVSGGAILSHRAGIDPATTDSYMAKLRDDTRKGSNVDPRVEPTLMTMCRHAFLVGINCGREAERRER